MKIAFFTLGCKVNQYETEMMIQKFTDKGYKLVEFESYADIYVVNSCTVTNMADKKTRQSINSCRKKNPESIVILVGCYVQAQRQKLQELNIDIIIGNEEKTRIIDIVEEYFLKKSSENKILEVSEISKVKEYNQAEGISKTTKTRATIKIEDGCDNFCSYCIIPYVRGRVRSKPLDKIIEEAKALESDGIKEIIITGIEIASYGKDFNNNIKLIDVLEKLNNIEGIERIRLGSLEPRCIDNEFVSRIKKLNKICPHFHLSLQSGSDDTLKRMNRKYNTKDYFNSVNLIREAFVDAQITTDIIVGFPGETEEEFFQTCEFVKKINFSHVHIFKYSIRDNTLASKMSMQIDEREKISRSRHLEIVCKGIKEKVLGEQIGKKYQVLFEEYISKNRCLEGYTTNYIRVRAKGDKKLCEKIQEVEIFGLEGEIMLGKI